MKPSEDFSFCADRTTTRPAGIGVGRLLAFLLPMAFALYANFQGVQLILVPVQVEAIDPSRKIANLALLTIFCAITGVAGLMAGGALTDATRSRWGRRARWLAAMAIASALLAVALGFQRQLAPIAALYATLWFTLNFFQAAMLAATPDRVPLDKRSLASSILGLGAPLGALIGVNLVAWATGESGYAALAALLIATTAAFTIFAREGAFHGRGVRPRFKLSGALRSLSGFRSRDFATLFVLRVTMFVAQFSINNYLLYILQDHIGAANLPAGSGRIAAGFLSSLRILVTVVVILFAGWIAGRTSRRKIFAEIYAFAMAAASVAPILSPTWLGMLLFAALGGGAMGFYSAVDLDVMAHVLPDKTASGRDLSVLVMAGAAAQLLAPVIGGGVIKLLGYDALFAFGALGALGVGAAALRLQSVR
jgi:MFS family permease